MALTQNDYMAHARICYHKGQKKTLATAQGLKQASKISGFI
jgi:hypothetical protein